jgi:hypothetical protein
MIRSRDRPNEVLADGSAVGSDEAGNRLYHFFQDALHLKDWLQSDPIQRGIGREYQRLRPPQRAGRRRPDDESPAPTGLPLAVVDPAQVTFMDCRGLAVLFA